MKMFSIQFYTMYSVILISIMLQTTADGVSVLNKVAGALNTLFHNELQILNNATDQYILVFEVTYSNRSLLGAASTTFVHPGEKKSIFFHGWEYKKNRVLGWINSECVSTAE